MVEIVLQFKARNLSANLPSGVHSIGDIMQQVLKHHGLLPEEHGDLYVIVRIDFVLVPPHLISPTLAS